MKNMKNKLKKEIIKIIKNILKLNRIIEINILNKLKK